MVLILLLAGRLAAQVTGISPTSVSLDMVQSGVAAPGYKINVLGAGAYTATIHGSTTCVYFRYGGLTGTAGTDGIWLWNYQTSVTQAPGAYSCNVVFDFAGTQRTVAVSYTIHRRWMWEYATNGFKLADSALGCTKETAEHSGYGVCATAQYTPAGGWTPPNAGDTYTDPTFGFSVRRLALSTSPNYGSNSHINLDNTLITTNSGVSQDGVWTIADGTRRGSHPSAGGGFWSLVDRRDKYVFSGTALQRVRCNDTNCTGTTTTTVYTHSEGMYQGGNIDLAQGDVIPFWTNDDGPNERKEVCVVEVHSGLAAVCASLSAWPWGRPAATSPTQGAQVQMSAPDGAGYRYVYVRLPYADGGGAYPSRLMIYSYKNRALTLLTPNGLAKPYFPQSNGVAGSTWGIDPTLNPYLMSGAHSDIVVAGGRAFYLPSDPVRTDPASGIGIAMFDLTRIREGYGSTFALELGGYMQIGIGTQYAAEYPSCAQLAPVCMITDFSKASVSPEGFGISALTHNGTQATITTALYGSASNHGLSVGDTVLVSNSGLTGLPNGTYTTQSGTTGSTVVVNCSGTCSGTFAAAGFASLVKSQAQSWQTGGNVYEVQSTRFWQHGAFHRKRHAKVRGVQYNGCRGPYTDQFTHGGISPDGSTLYYKDNHGVPCAGGAHIVNTGWILAPDTPSRHFSRLGDGMEIAAASDKIVVRVACAAAWSLKHSVNRDLAGATITAAAGSQTVALSATASTRYYLQLVCDEDAVAVDQIDTTAAPGGNATLRITGFSPAGTATMRVDYGASNQTAACAAGSECAVEITAARGSSLATTISWLDAGGATIRTEPSVLQPMP